jgi:hypothetical protein
MLNLKKEDFLKDLIRMQSQNDYETDRTKNFYAKLGASLLFVWPIIISQM